MSEAELYRIVLWCWIGVAAAVFGLLFFVAAPYGRHARGGWGPLVSARAGWLVMETPALYVFALCWLPGGRIDLATVVLAAMWGLHYGHRSLVYPFRLRGSAAPMPLSVVGMALFFNLVNAYFQGRSLGHFGPVLPPGWLVDARFVGGAVLFLGGMAINLHADAVLLRLRRTQRGYQIPRGGLYRWVSCPNYLGELVEWCGWAAATWSLAGLSFAAWTAANLVPRAVAHHRWYRARLDGYPAERRAIIPYLL